MHKSVKCSFLTSYMLKTPSLLTQGFKNNKKVQDKIFNNMCNYGARAECRSGRISASSYLGVDTRNYQYHLLNPIPLDYIKGYITEDAIGDRA